MGPPLQRKCHPKLVDKVASTLRREAIIVELGLVVVSGFAVRMVQALLRGTANSLDQ